MAQKTLEFYLRRFEKLRVSRSTDEPAPHKPILLLSVLQLLEQGVIQENRIFLTPDLISSFLRLWKILVNSPHRPDIALPFFHLKGDGFWHLKPKNNYASTCFSGIRIRTSTALREIIHYVYLENGLYELLLEKRNRFALAERLCNKWFPTSPVRVCDILGIDSFHEYTNDILSSGGDILTADQVNKEDELILRKAAFRSVVTNIYDVSCAVCKIRVISTDSRTIVDAAHIAPFSQFRDDRIVNGLCLCKNHHWAFDHGWFSVTNNYSILVSKHIDDGHGGGKFLLEYEGERIALPHEERYLPDPERLHWHQVNTFLS